MASNSSSWTWRGATTKSFCKEVIGQRKWQDHLVLNALEKHCGLILQVPGCLHPSRSIISLRMCKCACPSYLLTMLQCFSLITGAESCSGKFHRHVWNP